MKTVAKARPFSLQDATALRRIPLPVSLLERSLALHRLDRLYRALPPAGGCAEFLQQTLDTFQIRCQAEGEELRRIPAHGPTVLVANHPFGAIEGVLMAHLLLQIRPDIRIMANHLLSRIPELQELFISVDPFGGKGSAERNRKPLREALRWVKNGGLLLLFPAGEVSHYRPDKRCVTDPEWGSPIVRLIRLAGAPVVPCYIHGSNSLLFQLAGMVHPRLRTALLPRQLTNKAGRQIPIRIGEPIPARRVRASGLSDVELASELRLRTYMLGERLSSGAQRRRVSNTGNTVPVALPARTGGELAEEIRALPDHQHLVDGDDLQVYFARAGQIPNLLREIGRLRELSFRETGEGTGQERDLDLYDAYYRHLFIWNRKTQEVVGAYRLGLADQIVAKYGKQGLYSHSLFRYRSTLLERLNPAIELGRSFIRLEYQRSFSPLLLLWKGIGEFVLQRPRYRILFGPVSISGEYQTLSQQMMVSFLEANRYLPGLAHQIRPRRPFRRGNGAWLQEEIADLREIDLISELVSQIEPDRKGVPILLKQYLKMGGHLLGFNVDPKFNHALDGLIMVDLRQTPERLLQRYMGEQGAREYLAHHSGGVAQKAS